jgi:hypothetical protein
LSCLESQDAENADARRGTARSGMLRYGSGQVPNERPSPCSCPFVHLFGNMLFLWIYGDNVERRHAPPRG